MLSLICLLTFLGAAQEESAIKATVRMDRPGQHFYQMELVFPASDQEERLIQMATWTPGSYKIRDFAKSVEAFGAFDTEDKPLAWVKHDKSTWKIQAPAGSPFVVRYDVFAYEFTVRTSYLDTWQGFINPASVFLYEAEKEQTPYDIQVKPPEGWAAASALPKTGIFRFRAENLDQLIDSPFQFGRFRRHEFQVKDIPHYWLIAGDVNVNEQEMVKAMTAIGNTVGDLFGSFPFENYYIFSQFRLDGAGGGLEHVNSTMVQGHGNKLRSSKGWDRFLSLIIHEYFHAWNVKAIRDEVLGPFDYQDENYTELLWLHEGWTSYYDTLLMGRSGFWDDKRLLKAFAEEIERYVQKPATSRQSLRDASFNSWIHQYQPSKTRYNSQVSYYSDGALSGLALDLLIRNETKGEKSLDDVMRVLYNDYALKDRGISWDIVVQVLEQVAGTPAVDFLNTYVANANPLPMEMFLEYAGLEMTWKAKGDSGKPGEEKKEKPYAPNPPVSMGVTTNTRSGAVTVGHVLRGGPGWEAGLDFGDELLAINNRRVRGGNLNDILGWSRPGDEVEVLLSRAGKILTVAVKLEEKHKSLKLTQRKNPGTLDTKIYEAMFGVPKKKDSKEDDTKAAEKESE